MVKRPAVSPLVLCLLSTASACSLRQDGLGVPGDLPVEGAPRQNEDAASTDPRRLPTANAPTANAPVVNAPVVNAPVAKMASESKDAAPPPESPSPDKGHPGPAPEKAAPLPSDATVDKADAAIPSGTKADAATPRDLAATTDTPQRPPTAEGEPVGTCPSGNADLLLCLRFEGQIFDESVYAQKINSFMPQFMPGPTGQALNHGFLTRVRVAESNSLDSDHITMEAWINPRTFPGHGGRGAIFDNNGQYGLFLLPGGFLTCNGATSLTTNDPVVALNQWSAVACTADSEGMAIWVEGRKVAEGRGASLSKAGSIGTAVGSNLPDGDTFDGLIDNVRLWKTSRNPRQLCAAARVCKALS